MVVMAIKGMIGNDSPYSEDFKQKTIQHMMEVIQLKIYNKHEQVIMMKYPETEEEKAKLVEMYNRALETIGK